MDRERLFRQDLAVGGSAKDILRSLFELSGYTVYPFGYESSMSALKKELTNHDFANTPLVHRIRSMPDFLVSGDGKLQMVEVKFRSKLDNKGQPSVLLSNWEVSRYMDFWPESILVLISNHDHRFYAKHVRDFVLGSYEQKWFQYTDFYPLPDIFPKTAGKLDSFHRGVDKLVGMWK
ncbi:hypothetical protein AUF62_02535 [archaeon 13_1_20CM_52_20]|nr:MAG: hypothetical protein AUF62_02535 [archaeon 13_1_20CM_52_20]